MIARLLALCVFYWIGLFFGLLFRKRIPVGFFAVTGFIWGALFYVILAMFLLNFALPYSLPVVTASVLLLLALLLALYFRSNDRRLDRNELTWVVAGTLTFIVTATFFSVLDKSLTTGDSTSIMRSGEDLARNGLTAATVQWVSLRGVFQLVFQSAGALLGMRNMYVAQPLFAFSFIAVFIYLGQYCLSLFVKNRRLAFAIVLLTALAFFSTHFMLFQIFYVHMNMPAGLYLFVAVVTAWLAFYERKYTWLLFSMLATVAFALLRVEAPLFAIVWMTLLIGVGRMERKLRFRSCLLVAVFLAVWYGRLLFLMGDGTYMLDPLRTGIIVLIELAFIVFVLVIDWPPLRRWLPVWPVILVAGMFLVQILLFTLKTNQMQESIISILYTMTQNGGWGINWYLLAVLLFTTLFQERFDFDTLFSTFIVLFFLVLLAVDFPARTPFGRNWGSPSNRMFTHIIAIIYFYLLLKLGPPLASALTRWRTKGERS